MDPSPPPAAPSTQPPSHYYLEPPSNADGARAPSGSYFEPPPPGTQPSYVYEPPPPPEPRHTAPKTALTVGLGGGWFFPSGPLAEDDRNGDLLLESLYWSEVAASGPSVDLNVGVRLDRRYQVFGLWQRGFLRAASLTPGDLTFSSPLPSDLRQDGGTTDFYAVGMSFESDPDRIGMLANLAFGYRNFRMKWQDGSELNFDGGFHARIGFGASFRLNRLLSLSPTIQFGVGSAGRGEWVLPDGTKVNALTGQGRTGLFPIGLTLGGTVDLLPSDK